MAVKKTVRIIKKIREDGGQWRFVSLRRAGTRYAWDKRPGHYFVEWWEGRSRRRQTAGQTPSEAMEAQRRKRNELVGERVLGTKGELPTQADTPLTLLSDAIDMFLQHVRLEDCGYESKTSDKGRYEAETMRKFGGLESAGYALWSQKRRELLMKFLDKSESVKGVHDEGVYLKDRRRYLNFVSISKIVGSDALAREIIDDYVEKGIFYRGYIFQCENCSDAAWHSISDIDQTFTCRRCGLKQQYKSKSWKHPNEPAWFYKLDEMIYLMLKNNGHVPVLTLNKLRIQSKESFLFRPELRMRLKGSTKMFLEVDLWCIADGRLCIGEAKSNDRPCGHGFHTNSNSRTLP